jgi:transcriptional regulator with PAS, ATPase and Fis domain
MSTIIQIVLQQDNLSALFAAFLSAVALVLNQVLMHFKNKKPSEDAKQAITKLTKQVTEIQSELVTNGGSTTKDKLIKTCELVEACVSDLSEVKKDIGAIKVESRSRMEIIMENSTDALFQCNQFGECTISNESMRTLFGMSDVSGFNWLRAITSQELRLKVKRDLDESIANTLQYRDTFEIMNQTSRTKHTVTATITPVTDDTKRIIFFNGKIKINEKA